jgi:hypothetical protein
VVNRTGATFINFIAAESGAPTADVIRAFTLAREVFDLEPLWDQLDALDYKVDSRLQLDLLAKLIAIAQRASRWMLRIRAQGTDMPTLIQRYQPAAREMRANLTSWLPVSAQTSWQQATDALVQAGVDATLAQSLTALEFIFPALDLVDLAQTANTALEHAARRTLFCHAAGRQPAARYRAGIHHRVRVAGRRAAVAQATDVGVNKATRKLFPVAGTPQAILDLGLEGLEGYIKTIGLYKSKAKHLLETCRILVSGTAAWCPARAKRWRPCPAWAAKPPTWC